METQLRNLDQNQDLHVENLKMDHLGLWCTLHHRGRCTTADETAASCAVPAG